jgi:hypothetical protein
MPAQHTWLVEQSEGTMHDRQMFVVQLEAVSHMPRFPPPVNALTKALVLLVSMLHAKPWPTPQPALPPSGLQPEPTAPEPPLSAEPE